MALPVNNALNKNEISSRVSAKYISARGRFSELSAYSNQWACPKSTKSMMNKDAWCYVEGNESSRKHCT